MGCRWRRRVSRLAGRIGHGTARARDSELPTWDAGLQCTAHVRHAPWVSGCMHACPTQPPHITHVHQHTYNCMHLSCPRPVGRLRTQLHAPNSQGQRQCALLVLHEFHAKCESNACKDAARCAAVSLAYAGGSMCMRSCTVRLFLPAHGWLAVPGEAWGCSSASEPCLPMSAAPSPAHNSCPSPASWRRTCARPPGASGGVFNSVRRRPASCQMYLCVCLHPYEAPLAGLRSMHCAKVGPDERNATTGSGRGVPYVWSTGCMLLPRCCTSHCSFEHLASCCRSG